MGQKISSKIREQLGIFNTKEKLTQYKINWREHIQRMNEKTTKKITNLKEEEIQEDHKRDGEMIFLEKGIGHGA